LAGFPFQDHIWGLLRVVGPEKLLYGSDFPLTPHRGVVKLADVMRRGVEEIFDDKVTLDGIYVANARRLLAR
jgi:predicted TIM-barrel fold metal-dependent hydrolase